MADAPFHYSYHNRPFIERLLALYHGAAEAKAAEQEAKTGIRFLVWPLDKALKSARQRYLNFCGNTSKYAPHQGEKEMARRRRQITGERSARAFSLR